MEQQIDSIGIYADSIGVKDSADWELKIRRAVEENSTEYKHEMATKQMLEAIEEETEPEETKTTIKSKKQTKKQNDCFVPGFNDWNTFLLVVIAFLLFLNLIFNK